jgi:hypothetical protein
MSESGDTLMGRDIVAKDWELCGYDHTYEWPFAELEIRAQHERFGEPLE